MSILGIGGSDSNSSSLSIQQNRATSTAGASSPIYNGNVTISNANGNDLATQALNLLGKTVSGSQDTLGTLTTQVLSDAQKTAANTASGGQTDNNATFTKLIYAVAAVIGVAVLAFAFHKKT